MAANMGAVKLLLIGCCGALGGGSGYLINWPTKSIGAGKMQVLFKKFDFDNDKTPWTTLMAKTTNNQEYFRPDSSFEQEIVELRKKLEGDTEKCINSKSTDEETNSCKASWDEMKKKIGTENINTLKNYCKNKESEEITGQNLNSMKGYMAICYDMSEMWYFA